MHHPAFALDVIDPKGLHGSSGHGYSQLAIAQSPGRHLTPVPRLALNGMQVEIEASTVLA